MLYNSDIKIYHFKLVLGSQLFTIDMKDLAERIKCCISKFANDTKLRGIMSSEQDVKGFYRDLD